VALAHAAQLADIVRSLLDVLNLREPQSEGEGKTKVEHE
jgi:hypothetical protein